MCVLCAVDPINFLDGTHARIDGFLDDAVAVPDLDALSATDQTLGNAISGEIEAGLLDDGSALFRLDLGVDGTAVLDLADLGDGATVGASFTLYDANGALIADADDASDGLVEISADADSPVYLLISRPDGNTAASGTGEGGEAGASNMASLETLADFLTHGYWNQAHKFNLSDEGYMAKGGQLTFNVSGYSGDANGLTAERQDMVREAFNIYEAMLGIDFVETTAGSADFRFGDNQGGAYAGSSYGVIGDMGYISYAYININSGWYGSSSALDGYTFQTALHEIGHALGLGHQGSYNGSANYSQDAEYANDSWQASMMSYFSQNQNTAIDASYAFLLSPMAADWIALNNLYGEYGYSTANAFTGDTVWGFNTTITADVSAAWADLSVYGDNTAFTIVDAGGIDTVDFSGYYQDQRIDLTITEGSFTQATTSDIGFETGNMTLAVGTVIENAVAGSGNDRIIGNIEDNTLDGGAGDDTLTGGIGDDVLIGGAGTDAAVFLMDLADYTFTSFTGFWEVIGEGLDQVYDTIETLVFADQSVAYADLVETAPAPAPEPEPVADPDARDDLLSVAEGGTLTADLFADNGFGADTHSAGEAFTVTALGSMDTSSIILENGAVLSVDADGALSFATNGAYESLALGETREINVSYTISTADGTSDTAVVTLTVIGENDGPIAADDAMGAEEGAILTGNLLADNGSGLDADPDASDVLVVVDVNGSDPGTLVLASGALLSVASDGTFTYDQAGAFEALVDGETAIETFSYILSDGHGGTDTATATITIFGDGPVLHQTGTAGNEQMTGTEYGDTIDGGAGEDELDGGTGRDRLYGGEGDDTVAGGSDNDRLWGDAGNDVLDAGSGSDRAYGGTGDDRLSGGEDNDLLRGGDDNDVLFGDDGRDLLDGGLGDDALFGGAGRDRLLGREGNDSLSGGAENDRLFGEEGDDHLMGDEGGDRLDGGTGNDTLDGGAGSDFLTGRAGADSLFGGAELDILSGGADNDLIDAGGGDDRAYGGDGDDHLIGGDGDDRLGGSAGNDTLDGGTGNDRLDGGLGADVMSGGTGVDRLRGRDGADVLDGGAGGDILNGGDGTDTASYASASAGVTARLSDSAGNTGDAAGDLYYGIENIEGSAFSDVLAGDESDNRLTGGTGADRFEFDARMGNDVITDFEDGVDAIQFMIESFSFDDLEVVQDGDDTVLRFAESPEQALRLTGILAEDIDASDFA